MNYNHYTLLDTNAAFFKCYIFMIPDHVIVGHVLNSVAQFNFLNSNNLRYEKNN